MEKENRTENGTDIKTTDLSTEELVDEISQEQEKKEEQQLNELEEKYIVKEEPKVWEEEEEEPTFTNEVVVIRPHLFYENELAQIDNKFMKNSGMEKVDTNAVAQEEFDNFKKTLESAGIKVHEFSHSDDRAPDAIFPDWFTTHKNDDIPEGVFILYPMKHATRQLERDQKIIAKLSQSYKHFIDLSHWEQKGKALEGKGSVVFDYRNQKLYCTLSPRADQDVINDLIKEWNKLSLRPYKAVTFTSYDRHGEIIYHTDCMMTLLSDHAVVAHNCIKDKKERKRLLLELSNPPLNTKAYQIFELDRNEIEGMCANMFNLVDKNGKNTIIMSDRARRTFTAEKFQILTSNYQVLVANIDMIEHVGGGSTRCMLAEKF